MFEFQKSIFRYIIDVGTLYDLKGKTRSRTSLKTLAQVFLRKEIQDETIGHCSVEDALATLELLQLKFKNGFLNFFILREFYLF